MIVSHDTIIGGIRIGIRIRSLVPQGQNSGKNNMSHTLHCPVGATDHYTQYAVPPGLKNIQPDII
jgi:hypothetical protein